MGTQNGPNVPFLESVSLKTMARKLALVSKKILEEEGAILFNYSLLGISAEVNPDICKKKNSS